MFRIFYRRNLENIIELMRLISKSTKWTFLNKVNRLAEYGGIQMTSARTNMDKKYIVQCIGDCGELNENDQSKIFKYAFNSENVFKESSTVMTIAMQRNMPVCFHIFFDTIKMCFFKSFGPIKNVNRQSGSGHRGWYIWQGHSTTTHKICEISNIEPT